jgi:hypothetical protein
MFLVSNINKTHSKHFSELPKTSGGHSRKLPPVIYTIPHTVLDLEWLIQLFKWLKIPSDVKRIPTSSMDMCYTLKKSGVRDIVKQERPYMCRA